MPTWLKVIIGTVIFIVVLIALVVILFALDDSPLIIP